MEGYMPLILKSKLFEGFSKSECKEVCSLIQPEIRNYIKNEIIVNEGEKLGYIGIICSGRIVRLKLDYQGNSHLLEIIEKPKMFGMEIAATASQVSPIMIRCEEETSIVAFNYNNIKNNKLLDEAYRIRILNNLISLIANDNIKKLYKIEVLSQKSLRDRILMHLYLMEEKTGGPTFHIGMNREQFAQYLCVNRSALSHELSLMQNEGLISFKKDLFAMNQHKTR